MADDKKTPPTQFTPRFRTDIYPFIYPSKFRGSLDGKVAIITGLYSTLPYLPSLTLSFPPSSLFSYPPTTESTSTASLLPPLTQTPIVFYILQC